MHFKNEPGYPIRIFPGNCRVSVPYSFVILAGVWVVVSSLQASFENLASKAPRHWRIIAIFSGPTGRWTQYNK